MFPSLFAESCRRLLEQLPRQRLKLAESRMPGIRFQPRMEQLEERFLPAISLLQDFPDINFNQAFDGTPPDTMMAVGPNTVVGAVNVAITLTNKSGGARVGPTPFATFFSTIFTSGDRFSDPYVVYDDQADRFYVTILEFAPNLST